ARFVLKYCRVISALIVVATSGQISSRVVFPSRSSIMLLRVLLPFIFTDLLLVTSSVVAFTGSPSQPLTTFDSLTSPSRSRSQLLFSSRADYDDGVERQDRFPTAAPSNRRSFVRSIAAASLLTSSVVLPASAGIDPSALKSLPVEGDATGATSRLRQLSSLSDSGPRPEDSKDIAFEVLPSGASYREYREGKGDAAVRPGSKVAVEMTVRCRSFATANEPGGLKYFSTRDDTEFNELAWTVGEYSGEGSNPVPPELEEAMMGMKKGAVRRIELPSTVVFKARNSGRLPVPAEKNKDGRRLFERLFKTDATLLFEVLVTRIK
ncbi:hypothetical protein ACHAXS_011682, partial [Conticribra weissflogii]